MQDIARQRRVVHGIVSGHHSTLFRSCCESTSKTTTTSTMRAMTAQVYSKAKLQISSHSTMPMPPAPTTPTTVAGRTLDSKRCSE